MSFSLSEITPQDPYVVKVIKPIHFVHISNIIDMYQPTLGAEATNFYLTLTNHIPLGQVGVSQLYFHRGLMGQMQQSFPAVMKARKILEAVGLLKSKRFKHKKMEEIIYEYTIIPPLEPEQFFQSDILSLLLYNRVGKLQFQSLKRKLLSEQDWNHEEYEEKEITKAFDEVFGSILPSELKYSKSEFHQWLQPYEQRLIEEDKTIRMKQQYLDIDFIKGMVSELFPLHKHMDQKTIDLLQELAFLYQLSEVDMVTLLKDHTVYNKQGKIDQTLLRKRIRETYKFEKKEILLVDKEKIPVSHAKENSDTTNKAKKHQWILENYSPVELMLQYQGGGKIPESDLELIESLLYDYKLPSGVVNVLIEYVMLSNEYKFPRKLTEKIAGHWKRLKINTVQEAQDVAKKEHNLYKKWKDINQNEKKQIASANRKTTNKPRKEHIPDYILQQEEKYHDKGKKKQNELDEQTKEEIDQLLKELEEF